MERACCQNPNFDRYYILNSINIKSTCFIVDITLDAHEIFLNTDDSIITRLMPMEIMQVEKGKAGMILYHLCQHLTGLLRDPRGWKTSKIENIKRQHFKS